MKTINFEKVDEKIYVDKLDNGLEVYLYPTKKTKNFYISISVKYGARVNKYRLNNHIYNVIPGSAHFLEHKVMALSENEEISKRINELGSLANAWTSNLGTNYNIFGSINLIENLKILLDLFYNTNINEKCVLEEKGIIGEEIDMNKDHIEVLMYNHLFNNLFNKSYVKNTVLGERSDIDKITAKSLNKVYNDYYVANNTFIIVTGDFDKDEVSNIIRNYINSLKLKSKVLPRRVKPREKNEVSVPYEEIQKDMEDVRVKYALKINKNNFNIKNEILLRHYLAIVFCSNFSSTSLLYERYKNDGIIINMSSEINIIDDYVVLIVNAFTKDGNKFIDNIKKDINNLNITATEFDRKRKGYLKNYILDFDNIEDVEYDICISLMMINKVNYKEYSQINNMDYNEALKILKSIHSDNVSIIRTIK